MWPCWVSDSLVVTDGCPKLSQETVHGAIHTQLLLSGDSCNLQIVLWWARSPLTVEDVVFLHHSCVSCVVSCGGL